jgi:hypothetical protein
LASSTYSGLEYHRIAQKKKKKKTTDRRSGVSCRTGRFPVQTRTNETGENRDSISSRRQRPQYVEKRLALVVERLELRVARQLLDCLAMRHIIIESSIIRPSLMRRVERFQFVGCLLFSQVMYAAQQAKTNKPAARSRRRYR